MLTHRSLLRTLIVLLLTLALGACLPIYRGGGGDDDDDDDATTDDDDTVGDDDDATTDDDDDDTVADDDDTEPPSGFSYNGMSFAMELTSTPGVGAMYGVLGTFTVVYWTDIQAGIENCRQRVEFEGSGQFAVGVASGCTNCTGIISIDESLTNDVTNPAIEPTDCDTADLMADEDGDGNPDHDWGNWLLTSPTSGGLGDFLNLGLVDIDTFTSLGLTTGATNTDTGAEISTYFSDYALEATHAFYVLNDPGSLADGSGLAAVAQQESPGSSWYSFGAVFKNPAENMHAGTDLNGDYGVQMFWIITFNP